MAAGRPLSEAAIAAAHRALPDGHAIEVRVSAEDPGRDFTPTPGLIRHWVMPAGSGIRVDTAVAAGERIPPEYDNLLAKIMVHAQDRDTALDLLAAALARTEVAGIQTTLPFHSHVAGHRGFRAGELSTEWVAEHWDGPAAAGEAGRLAQLAAALSIAAQDVARATRAGSDETDGRASSWAEPSPEPAGWAEAALEAMVDRWPTS